MLKKILRLFRKNNYVHIVDSDFKFVKKNIKLKSIPQIGEYMYYGSDNINIFEVTSVLYNIGENEYHIFIMTKPYIVK